MLYNNTARAFISGEQPLNLVLVKLHPHSLHLYLCIPLILPFLTYLLLLHFLHSVFIFLFSLLLAIFILASYLSYGNTPLFPSQYQLENLATNRSKCLLYPQLALKHQKI
ncbi:hypothetical protein Bandiella_00195 [Candidatus Bandiella woodruffii]|uniref:Uncharacterized protein n=1 Tax=Candidatus Bandiella euplotis TaxID=1664265 RepID=A0ABZ0ULG1_9RICK|nr:hypothetical protein Bandiella_00195 [Candidatus Bandiella woodruffii]